VPLERLPDWLRTLGSAVPLMHGIAAARKLAAGESLGDAGHLLLVEAAIGSIYLVLGLVLLRFFEHEGRRTATLETF